MSRLKPLLAAGAKRSLGVLWSVLRGEETPAKAALRLKLGLKLDTRQWNPELLKQLEWRRFEEVCAAYYESLGFAVGTSGGGTPAGVDIVIRDKAAKTQSIARCKAWDAYRVGPKAVRELRRAMDAAKIADGTLLTAGRSPTTRSISPPRKHPADRRSRAPRKDRRAGAGQVARACSSSPPRATSSARPARSARSR